MVGLVEASVVTILQKPPKLDLSIPIKKVIYRINRIIVWHKTHKVLTSNPDLNEILRSLKTPFVGDFRK